MEYKKVVCHVPKRIYSLCNRERQKPSCKRDWINVYWFKNHFRNNLENTPVVEVYTGQTYNKNTLYKNSELSNNDMLFDHYKIIKDDIKKNNLLLEKKNYRIAYHEKQVRFSHFPKDNPHVLTFD